MQNAPMPAAPKERNPWTERVIVAAILVVALVLGILIGLNAQSEHAAAAPATVTASPEVRTETVTTEVTPQSCLDALDSAETIFQYAAKGFGAASRGFNAASRLDVAGVYAASADMTAASKLVGGETGSWKRARDKCRASA